MCLTVRPIGLIGVVSVTGPAFISSIKDLASQYDALLCDAWGVIHNGVDLFPGAGEALVQFRKHRGPVVILTNAPRPSSIIPAQLDQIGLPREAYDVVVTSGDATRAAIEAYLPAPAFRLGPAKDDPLFEGLAIEFAPLGDAQFIVCTGLENDDREGPEDYRDVLIQAASLNLPMVCANPDIVVNWGGKIIWCAGALAEIYETLGGKVVYGGKPHAPIYDVAYKAISKIRPDIARSRILAIGDGVNTDIKGANVQGIDVLYVTGDGGVHTGDKGETAIAATLAAAGAHAMAVSEGLQW